MLNTSVLAPTCLLDHNLPRPFAGFTHNDADVIAKGKLTGTAAAPFLEVSGTQDRFALTPAATGADIASLLGKTVTVAGVLPQAPKGKVSDTLHYKTISEAR